MKSIYFWIAQIIIIVSNLNKNVTLITIMPGVYFWSTIALCSIVFALSKNIYEILLTLTIFFISLIPNKTELNIDYLEHWNDLFAMTVVAILWISLVFLFIDLINLLYKIRSSMLKTTIFYSLLMPTVGVVSMIIGVLTLYELGLLEKKPDNMQESYDILGNILWNALLGFLSISCFMILAFPIMKNVQTKTKVKKIFSANLSENNEQLALNEEAPIKHGRIK